MNPMMALYCFNTCPLLKEDNRVSPMELLPNEVHIWSAKLNQIPYREALRALLSEDELKRADQFKFEELRRNFIATKGILRQLIERYTDMPAGEIQFEYGVKGKPELTNHALQFNVSHSHELAVYAFTLQQAVGIDVEYTEREVELLSLAKRFFADAEYQQLKRLPEEKQHLAFFHAWTRKEAFIKAVREGLSYPLKKFVVSVLPEKAELISIEGKSSLADKWILQRLDFRENYVGALVVEGKINWSKQYEYVGDDW